MGDTNIQTDGLHVDRPLEDPIQIVIGLNGGALTGTAVTDAAKPSVNATVVLVPNPSARQRSDLYKTASTNASGEFKFAGIAPGDYKVFAWEDVETGVCQDPDPDFIKVYEDRGKPIHVGEGSAQVATVPAIIMVRP